MVARLWSASSCDDPDRWVTGSSSSLNSSDSGSEWANLRLNGSSEADRLGERLQWERCRENPVPAYSAIVPGLPRATRSAEDKIIDSEGRDAGDEDFTVVRGLPADPAVANGYPAIDRSEADLADRNGTKF